MSNFCIVQPLRNLPELISRSSQSVSTVLSELLWLHGCIEVANVDVEYLKEEIAIILKSETPSLLLTVYKKCARDECKRHE